MAAAPVLLAGALALLAAPASAQSFPLSFHPTKESPFSGEFTTSTLFVDLVQPLCMESSSYDACYGCFTRYSRMKQVEAAYEELKKCSKQYLNDTPFAQCSAPFLDAEVSLSQRRSLFCEFEKCVRKSHMLQVLEECAKQSDSSKSEVQKYIQTTSCITEELRRRKYLSGPRFGGQYHSPEWYALYVKAGELGAITSVGGNEDPYVCIV